LLVICIAREAFVEFVVVRKPAAMMFFVVDLVLYIEPVAGLLGLDPDAVV